MQLFNICFSFLFHFWDKISFSDWFFFSIKQKIIFYNNYQIFLTLLFMYQIQKSHIVLWKKKIKTIS